MKTRKDPFQQGMADYVNFIDQLYNAVSTNAVAWGIPAAAIAALLAVITPFMAFWAISKNKTTCTSVDRQNTRGGRGIVNAEARAFVQKWIYLNPLMTDADILSCGLQPRDKTKTPAPEPDTQPDMYLKPMNSHNIKGTFRQPKGEEGSSRRGKPAGVKSIRVAYFIGANPPAEPDDYGKFVQFTTTDYIFPFLSTMAGQQVTFAAAWVNEMEVQGDWCEPQTMVIP